MLRTFEYLSGIVNRIESTILQNICSAFKEWKRNTKASHKSYKVYINPRPCYKSVHRFTKGKRLRSFETNHSMDRMEGSMIYEITVPQFTKMLLNLQAILDKAAQYAESKKIDFEVLLNSRLAPDQYPLVKQVQIACDTAKLASARLTDRQAPVHEDKEKTLPELKARINEVIQYLGTFAAKDFNESIDRKISQPRWEGKYVTGLEYATQHAIPNLYFHVTTAYDILRHNGVEVGKKDYLGEMPFKK